MACAAARLTALTGEPRGGSTGLTGFSRDPLDRYHRIAARTQAEFADDLAALEAVARPTSGPKV